MSIASPLSSEENSAEFEVTAPGLPKTKTQKKTVIFQKLVRKEKKIRRQKLVVRPEKKKKKNGQPRKLVRPKKTYTRRAES